VKASFQTYPYFMQNKMFEEHRSLFCSAPAAAATGCGNKVSKSWSVPSKSRQSRFLQHATYQQLSTWLVGKFTHQLNVIHLIFKPLQNTPANCSRQSEQATPQKGTHPKKDTPNKRALEKESPIIKYFY
jgi:hypothetical protein